MMDKQREEFEKFSVETMKFRIDDCNDPYVKGMNERDWKIWQAAQAAMQPEIDYLKSYIEGQKDSFDVMMKRVSAANQRVEQLQADNARLREFVQLLADYIPNSAIGNMTVQQALATTDSSNWLQEQKAQWRREVLEEAANIVSKCEDDLSSRFILARACDELRRMAEQPESK